MTFHIFLIIFLSSDCADHVKPKMWFSIFHRWVNTRAIILLKEVLSSKIFAHAWPQICIKCIHIVTAVNISANWYESNHSFAANTTPEHGDIFWLLLSLKTFEIPELHVAFTKRSIDFSVLSYHCLSFVYKFNWFPVICLPAQLLPTPKHSEVNSPCLLQFAFKFSIWLNHRNANDVVLYIVIIIESGYHLRSL